MRGGEATPISVTWDPERRSPTAFVWRRRRWRVERIERSWVTETGWWSDELHVSRRHDRVVAEGRVFDLYFDRVARAWFLERVVA